MKINFLLSRKFFVFLLVPIIFLGIAAYAQENPTSEVPSAPSEAETLRSLIDQKSAELLKIQEEREKLEKSLEDNNKSKNTLTKELKTIDYNINQLNLSIKSNKLTLEKLDLEINSLGNNIKDIERGVQGKKDTIGKLFVELQQKDRENLLVILLKNRSLSASVSEAQSIASLNFDLKDGVEELRELQYQLSQKLSDETQKKKSRELEKINLTNRQYIVQDQKKEKQQVLTETKNQEKVYQQELQDLLKKQLEISEEVEKIEKELRTKIDPNLLPIPRPGVLGMPTQGTLSQEYGNTAFAKNGYRGKFHNGTDFAAPIGTPIVASESGVVEVTGDQDRYCPRGAYGKFVVIKHDNQLTTLSAHLSRIIVQKGDKVGKGDLIGYVGRTGYATGPHLHFTVYAGPTFYMGASRVCGPMPFGGDLDPAKYLPI